MKIFFSDNFKKIKTRIESSGCIVSVFILDQGKKNKDIENKLRKIKNCEIINRTELEDKYKDKFKDEYIEFIAKLNKAQKTFYWHALNLSTKSRLSYDFYFSLFKAYLISKLVDNNKNEELIIVCNNKTIISQIKDLADKKRYKFSHSLKLRSRKIIDFPNRIFPFTLTAVFLRTIIYKYIIKLIFKPKISENTNYFLIKTLLSLPAVKRRGNYEDIYFNKLIEHLKNRDIPFLIDATIFKPFLRNVLRLKRCKDGIIIIPREIYLTIIDLVKCYLISIKNFYCLFGIKSKIELDKIDVTKILYSEIKRECALKYYFLNLLEYFCTKSILNNIKTNRTIYPFEHRSWESMFIYAVREKDKNIKITGYQHTSIATKHTNMILAEEEYKYIPLPDKIISMGKISRDILEKHGNFPNTILQIGCALRQKAAVTGRWERKDNKKLKNILVALTTDTDEYSKILKILISAFKSNSPYKVKIRPHPLTNIERVSKGAPDIPDHLEFDENSDLEDSFDWADIVFYSSSTVSIEAIQRGIPVLYYDKREGLCPDPLFDLKDFKWKISSPDEIDKVIKIIQNTDKNTFQKAKNRAIEYASEYIYYPNKERMEVFIKDI